MSNEKPWDKHKFGGTFAHPDSCVRCGRPKDHPFHRGQTAWVRKFSKMLKRPDWKVFK